MWSGFYKKPLLERQSQLKLVFPQLFSKDGANETGMQELNNWPFQGLDERLADFMVENCIGYAPHILLSFLIS
jgi:hypothetical protein